MDLDFGLAVVSRFVHVATAIVLVGGAAFLRLILMPAADSTLTPEAHGQLRTGLLSRWRLFVHMGIALLLLSGLYNYWRIAQTISASGVKDSAYHAILGTKMILAFVIFFLASVLIGRSDKFATWRAHSKRWLVLYLILAAVIVAMSSYLRIRGRIAAPGLPTVPVQTALPSAGSPVI